MKKFVFSLEKVLGYKQQLLGMLKNELAALQARRLELEGQIRSTELQFDSNNQLLIDQMGVGMSRRNISSYKAFLAELNRRIVSLTGDLHSLEWEITAKQEEIVHMNSDISGLEHLKERQLAGYRSEAQKEQETLIEEFVSHAAGRTG